MRAPRRVKGMGRHQPEAAEKGQERPCRKPDSPANGEGEKTAETKGTTYCEGGEKEKREWKRGQCFRRPSLRDREEEIGKKMRKSGRCSTGAAKTPVFC